MATYKLIQDIEAEDHILGPLTLRQFIFALIAIFLFYINFLLVTKGAAFLMILFLPPALFFGFFALPFGRDQPTEIWALAKLRFWFKPRKRIWNQDGVKELVTITVPKKIEQRRTNGLSQHEVHSRLEALANTLDSRGWAVKNINIDSYMPNAMTAASSSDRLIDFNNMPQSVPNYDVVAGDDILDTMSSPIAQQFNTMIKQSSQAHRQQLMAQLNDQRVQQDVEAAPITPRPTDDVSPNYWFMGDNPQATPAPPIESPAAAALPAAEEAALAAELKSHAVSRATPYSNLRTVQPLGANTPSSQAPPNGPAPAQAQAVTPVSDPDILSLANNDDLNVATLARQAHKARGDDQPSGEVTISLR